MDNSPSKLLAIPHEDREAFRRFALAVKSEPTKINEFLVLFCRCLKNDESGRLLCWARPRDLAWTLIHCLPEPECQFVKAAFAGDKGKAAEFLGYVESFQNRLRALAQKLVEEAKHNPVVKGAAKAAMAR